MRYQLLINNLNQNFSSAIAECRMKVLLCNERTFPNFSSKAAKAVLFLKGLFKLSYSYDLFKKFLYFLKTD